MNWLLYLALGFTATWTVYLIYLQLATRAAEGRPTQDLERVLPELATASGEPALVYWYSPRCAPCRAMSREVEALQSEQRRIFKLDISEHFDLARDIGIRAAPTVLLVRRGQIERCILGAKPRAYLRALLDAA